MIIKWFEMKKKEIEFKTMLYTYGVTFMNEKEDVVKTVKDLYESCKDTPVTELRNIFVEKLAELAHEQAMKEKDSEENIGVKEVK